MNRRFLVKVTMPLGPCMLDPHARTPVENLAYMNRHVELCVSTLISNLSASQYIELEILLSTGCGVVCGERWLPRSMMVHHQLKQRCECATNERNELDLTFRGNINYENRSRSQCHHSTR